MAVSFTSIVAKLQRLESLSEFKRRFIEWGLKEKIVGIVFLILYYAPVIAIVVAQWWISLAILLVLCFAINNLKKRAPKSMSLNVFWLLIRLGGIIMSLFALHALTGWSGPIIYMVVLTIGAAVWVRSR